MRRILLVLGVSLLIAWGAAGPAIAGIISIAGNTLLDITLRDADRVEALTALFATTRGARVMQLSDGVGGRIARLQLAQAPFDAALEAMLGDEYVSRYEIRDGATVYRISNPKVTPMVLPLPKPAPAPSRVAPVLMEDTRYTTVLYIEPRILESSLGQGRGYRGPRISRRTRRPLGIHATETVPFITMNEYEDPFGNIIRAPEIYYQTYGMGYDFGNLNLYPEWPTQPYLDPRFPVPAGTPGGTS